MRTGPARVGGRGAAAAADGVWRSPEMPPQSSGGQARRPVRHRGQAVSGWGSVTSSMQHASPKRLARSWRRNVGNIEWRAGRRVGVAVGGLAAACTHRFCCYPGCA